MEISVNLQLTFEKLKSRHKNGHIFFLPLELFFFNTDNNIIIQQAHKGMPYQNPSSFDQVMGFKDGKKAHFSKPSQN